MRTRRRRERHAVAGKSVFRIRVEDRSGRPRWLTADVIDHNESGLGLALATPLPVGTRISVKGRIEGTTARNDIAAWARVAWCLERPDGSFRAGIEYESAPKSDPFSNWTEPAATEDEVPDDYYEVLQLSGNADSETVHRVYRILAQRYHPDNAETGNETVFRRVLEAYRVLSDPERRAAYDAERVTRRQTRWRIFDQRQASAGVEVEKRKRQGVLSLLYTQRVNEPDQPSLTIQELEELLECPRDHLQVSLWYLRETGLIQRSDNGRFSITAKGFQEAETDGTWLPDATRLLPSASGGSFPGVS